MLSKNEVYDEVRNLGAHRQHYPSIEEYALRRKERNPEKYHCLNLYECMPSKLLELIANLEKRNKHSEVLRFQCILDYGHRFTVDIQIDDNDKSLVLLDSVDGIPIGFKSILETLIHKHKFEVFMPQSTVPNLYNHTIYYGSPPPEMCSKEVLDAFIMSMRPAKVLQFYFIKNTLAKEGKNEWLYFFRTTFSALCSYEDKLVISNQVVTDEPLLAALNKLPDNKEGLTPLEDSSFSELILKSSLNQFDALHQQKDFSSCGDFALHHAIQAGKSSDLHAVCKAEKNNDNPHFLIKKEKDKIQEKDANLASITFVPWSKLPRKFCIWSQSVTFFQQTFNTQDEPRNDIKYGMSEKMRKR